MKVLMIGPSVNAKGGIATVVKNYLHWNFHNKVNIKYISTVSDGNIIKKIFESMISIPQIALYLSINKVDIVHIHMASRGSYARKSRIVKLSKLFKKKVILHLHGAEFQVFYEKECSVKKQAAIRNTFNKVDKIIVLSEQWKEFIATLTTSEITTLYNSVPLNEINSANGGEDILITFLGRLSERKGIYDLIEAAKELVIEFPNLKFMLGGDGEIEKVKNLLTQYSLNDNVKLLGWIEEDKKNSILRNTYIYILPSYNEGMPMSILEAMSYGIPVISTFAGGIPSVIKHNYNGLLVNAGDVKAIENSIRTLIKDKNKHESFKKNSYDTIKAKFSLEKHIDKLVSIYNSL